MPRRRRRRSARTEAPETSAALWSPRAWRDTTGYGPAQTDNMIRARANRQQVMNLDGGNERRAVDPARLCQVP